VKARVAAAAAALVHRIGAHAGGAAEVELLGRVERVAGPLARGVQCGAESPDQLLLGREVVAQLAEEVAVRAVRGLAVRRASAAREADGAADRAAACQLVEGIAGQAELQSVDVVAGGGAAVGLVDEALVLEADLQPQVARALAQQPAVHAQVQAAGAALGLQAGEVAAHQPIPQAGGAGIEVPAAQAERHAALGAQVVSAPAVAGAEVEAFTEAEGAEHGHVAVHAHPAGGARAAVVHGDRAGQPRALAQVQGQQALAGLIAGLQRAAHCEAGHVGQAQQAALQLLQAQRRIGGLLARDDGRGPRRIQAPAAALDAHAAEARLDDAQLDAPVRHVLRRQVAAREPAFAGIELADRARHRSQFGEVQRAAGVRRHQGFEALGRNQGVAAEAEGLDLHRRPARQSLAIDRHRRERRGLLGQGRQGLAGFVLQQAAGIRRALGLAGCAEQHEQGGQAELGTAVHWKTHDDNPSIE